MDHALFSSLFDGFADRVADRVIARLGERAGADEVLDRARVEAEYPIKFRVLTDAARRGEIAIEHAGRKPVVRRAELARWIASRPVTARPATNDAREDAAEAVRRAARKAAKA